MNWDDDTTGTPAPERLVGSVADREDQAVEAALRPKDLGEFIGQEKVREQLDLVLRAARARGATADHVLLSGAPAVGTAVTSGWRDQLHAALIGLGYATREADEAVAAVTPQAEAAGGAPQVGPLLRAALQTLNRAR